MIQVSGERARDHAAVAAGFAWGAIQPVAGAVADRIGTGRVIKGWDQGLIGMQVGGKRKLQVPAHLAYGERQIGALIKPNSNLVFEKEGRPVVFRDLNANIQNVKVSEKCYFKPLITPNPVYENFQLTSMRQMKTVRIYNLNGTLIHESHPWSYQADFNNLSNITKGLFLVEVTDVSGEVNTVKLMAN